MMTPDIVITSEVFDKVSAALRDVAWDAARRAVVDPAHYKVHRLLRRAVERSVSSAIWDNIEAAVVETNNVT